MRYGVIITSKAKLQLAETARWWADHRDVNQAARWLDGFERAIAEMSKHPERHSLARENELYELRNPVRQLLYGLGTKPTHRAVFDIRGDTVYVVAVRHLAQDDLHLEQLR